MKKFILISIVIIILTNYFKAYSQDIIDPPKLSQFDTSPVVDRNFNSFVIGWNWGTPGAMLDSAMYISGAGSWELGIWS